MFNNMLLYVRYIQLSKDKRSLFITDKRTLSSERMVRKNYYRKGSVAKGKNKISGREARGAWRQDELVGSKPSVVK
jgi:hypothetical protein